jgi:general secretion pathway protein B
MSYILDALKKAEHQRGIGQVPGIGSGQDAATADGPGRRWAWVLLVVLSLNAVLLAVVLWPEPAPLPQAAVPPPLPTPPHAASAPDSRTAPARQPAISRTAPDELVPVPATPVPLPLRPLPPLPAPPPTAPVEGSTATATRAPAMTIPSTRAASAYGDENLPVWPQVSDQLPCTWMYTYTAISRANGLC